MEALLQTGHGHEYTTLALRDEVGRRVAPHRRRHDRWRRGHPIRPDFQGLAISLMAGEVASLLLSRMAVPVLYYVAKRHERGELVPSKTPVEAAA